MSDHTARGASTRGGVAATIMFEDGTRTSARLVVSADGVHSTVRE
jgi:2-polyprenyl-6-methoxyphenol hydroxylase-like FAD-dependent oxidoreductase